MSTSLLRLPEVLQRCALSRSTAYELMQAGSFPKPVSVGRRRVAWVADEVEQWVLARIAETRSDGE